MTAMQRYLESKEGVQADIFQFVVDEVYKPLGIGPGFFSTMRTADDNWQGQPEGGYGLFWTPDDVVKISLFLNNSDGKINGVQILDPGLLAASLQRDSKDRGLTVSGRTMYNNAFWASQYSRSQGYDCDFWVTEMQGISGNVIAFSPNGITYYYFSDNQEFSWNNALKQADFLAPICSE
jgi:CubicO group peptidase (beta-lactamase class C family)